MKRKAPDTHVVSPVEASVAAVVSDLLRACASWRDRCGKAFRVERRIERREDRVVVRIGRFDTIRCDRLILASSRPSKQDHMVSGFDALCSSGEVTFFITRKPTADTPAPKGDGATPLNGDSMSWARR